MVKLTQSGMMDTLTRKSTIYPESDNKTETKQHFQNPAEISLHLRKSDIFSVLLAIEEIENKIKLNKILNKIVTPGEKEKEDDEESLIQDSREIRLMLSMLNISRNFAAVKFAQDHPSDEKNTISV